MRKIGLILVSVLMLLCCGCKEQTEAVDVLEIDASAPSESVSDSAALDGGGLELVDSTCYLFEKDGILQLYGAIEYINSSSSPQHLSKAELTFSSSQSVSYDLEPMLASYDVLMPGEHAYAAAWFPADGFSSTDVPSLQVVLHGATGGEEPVMLDVSDIFFADNYPGFTTMTGTLVNNSSESCSLNMIYAGLYDADGSFLGAWYFSQNAQLDPGDSVRFTTHLKAFPLNKLTEMGVSSQCRAFGFN